MRPLPVEPIAGVPAFVSGLALIRGAPTPVVDAAILLTGESGTLTRFVTLKAGSRRLALAVESVDGVVDLRPELLAASPPLLESAGPQAISAVGALDATLLVILRSARIISDDVWVRIEADETGA